jgi:hypothetical protein
MERVSTYERREKRPARDCYPGTPPHGEPERGYLRWDHCAPFVLGVEETSIPASEDATWDELTAEEQEAAVSLGYNQENWDATAPEE